MHQKTSMQKRSYRQFGRQALFISHKKTSATKKKNQYERDLQLSFIVHKLRNGH